MRNSLLFCFLFLCFSFVYSQTTYTKKYNTILERNEYFDNSGKLIGYQKYNTITGALEYTDVTTTNSNESGRYIVHDYGTPKSNFNANLAIQALAQRQQQQQQSNNDRYIRQLMDKDKALRIELNNYSDLDKRELAIDMYNERAITVLKSAVGKSINANDLVNQLIRIYNETVAYVNSQKISQPKTEFVKNKEFTIIIDSPLPFDLPLRSKPSITSDIVYNIPSGSKATVVDRSNETFVKISVNGYIGYIAKTWLKE